MIVFTDLDDTLMKTKRKIKGSTYDMLLGAVDKNGEPFSFVDKKREKFLSFLVKSKPIIIPVTARSLAAFNNVKLKFDNEVILNFGAIILDENKKFDINWVELIAKEILNNDIENIFKEISLALKTTLLNFEEKMVMEGDLCCYMNFRNYERNSKKLNDLKMKIENFLKVYGIFDSFYFYSTDRDLALLPSSVRKDRAVNYLIKKNKWEELLLVGIGDNYNDAAFMNLCDFAIAPTDSGLVTLWGK